MTAAPTFATLTKRADFLRLNRGQKYIAPCFILRAQLRSAPPSPDTEIIAPDCRIGYTVTTKCGNAVFRNRTKRRLRALARELLPLHGQARLDYVLIARADVTPTAADIPIAELRQQMAKALAYMQGRFQNI